MRHPDFLARPAAAIRPSQGQQAGPFVPAAGRRCLSERPAASTQAQTCVPARGSERDRKRRLEAKSEERTDRNHLWLWHCEPGDKRTLILAGSWAGRPADKQARVLFALTPVSQPQRRSNSASTDRRPGPHNRSTASSAPHSSCYSAVMAWRASARGPRNGRGARAGLMVFIDMALRDGQRSLRPGAALAGRRRATMQSRTHRQLLA